MGIVLRERVVGDKLSVEEDFPRMAENIWFVGLNSLNTIYKRTQFLLIIVVIKFFIEREHTTLGLAV